MANGEEGTHKFQDRGVHSPLTTHYSLLTIRHSPPEGAPMDKLIITVAGDSRTSYPHNHLCPPQEDIKGVAQQYIDAVNAGAAIAHIHGRRTLEESIQADGRQVSRIHHDDWK